MGTRRLTCQIRAGFLLRERKWSPAACGVPECVRTCAPGRSERARQKRPHKGPHTCPRFSRVGGGAEVYPAAALGLCLESFASAASEFSVRLEVSTVGWVDFCPSWRLGWWEWLHEMIWENAAGCHRFGETVLGFNPGGRLLCACCLPGIALRADLLERIRDVLRHGRCSSKTVDALSRERSNAGRFVWAAAMRPSIPPRCCSQVWC